MKKLFFALAEPSFVPSLTKWSYESNGSETRAICVPGSVSCGTCRKCRRGYLLLLSFYVIEKPSGIQSTSCYITWLRRYNFRNNKWGPVDPEEGGWMTLPWPLLVSPKRVLGLTHGTMSRNGLETHRWNLHADRWT